MSGADAAAVDAVLGAALPRDTAERDALPEDVLVRQAAAGRRPAFAELVRRHQGKVRGLLLRLCNDRALADDLAQEVFLRAYRGLVGFQGRSSFGTWLYRIGYNVYLNHRTRTKRWGALPEDYEVAAAAPEDALSPRRADLRRDLRAAIDTLPDRYRAVVVLYYLQEVSYPEIAEILDLPLGTVKTHLHRAKKQMRAQMEAWDGERASIDPAAEVAE